MSYPKYSLIVFVLFSITSCQTQKNNYTETTDFTMIRKDNIEQLSALGIIRYFPGNEAPCDYLIELSDRNRNRSLLEPFKLGENFKEGNLRVIINYSPQKRMSKCGNTIPVWILEIEIFKPQRYIFTDEIFEANSKAY